jgi:amino acid permease
MKKYFDALFKNSDGEVVIGQAPNLPITIWASTTFLGFITSDGPIKDVLQIVAATALAVWALMEVFQGVNYFRRLLGSIVLLYLCTLL